jgi:hypothetical protein
LLPHWLSLATAAASTHRAPRCSFCGLSAYRIVLGPDVTICENCVGLCDEILAKGHLAADISVLGGSPASSSEESHGD